MGNILLLSEETANKIAAGEVVERPASVVKELIENAIDACSSRIDIAVSGGGLERILVADNGMGMMSDDVPLAMERHATSKICNADDLHTVKTLGFRGEALPSIAAVSRFSIQTRRAEDLSGCLLKAEGGKIIKVEESGCPSGTEVKVSNLFYNTPARLKFIKSTGAETARIIDTVQRLAMSRPDISFSLSTNGKEYMKTPGSGKLLETIHQVYGAQISRQMIEVGWQGPLLSVQGYISKPSFVRANRNLQSFIVNKRIVRSPLLSDALQTAYQTLLPRRGFPAAVIYLEINMDEIDVNVHPAKREVRFSNERDVYRQLLAAVKQGLKALPLVGEINPTFSLSALNRKTRPTIDSTNLFGHNIACENNTINFNTLLSRQPETTNITSSVLAIDLPELWPLGQLGASFILAEGDKGDLYIVDQHAAHERILYDSLKEKIEDGELPVQTVMPQVIELDAKSCTELEENRRILEKLGLTFEPFGNNTFILRSVPLFIRDSLSQADILELLEVPSDIQNQATLFEETLKVMSCKAAVKANHLLSKEEMAALLKDLRNTNMPYTCPHGRPTILIFSAASLLGHFRRS